MFFRIQVDILISVKFRFWYDFVLIIKMYYISALFFALISTAFTLAAESSGICEHNSGQTSKPVHADIPKVLRHELCEKEVFCTEGEIEEYKPYIYLINGSEPGQTFIACTTPKSGGSRMKHLFYGIALEDYHGDYEKHGKYNHKSGLSSAALTDLSNFSEEELKRILHDTNIPRYIQSF
eukprot:TRINITY_DN2686_c0_g1_i4.p4 TRINITY_DN2686_c0_g1~~TRINITY_DN2686_c0_g1_i4.p4  ORF type:complete len:180 (+),score=2.85 TRINITY_DN2686_c0_g1_i4:2220-2759(+)